MEMDLQKSMHFLKTRSFPSSAFSHCLQASQSYFRDADSHRGQGGDGHFCHVPLETGARLSSLLQVSAVPVSLCISMLPIHCSWWKATPCSCLSAPPGSTSRAPSVLIWKQALPFPVCSKCIPFLLCVFHFAQVLGTLGCKLCLKKTHPSLCTWICLLSQTSQNGEGIKMNVDLNRRDLVFNVLIMTD